MAAFGAGTSEQHPITELLENCVNKEDLPWLTTWLGKLLQPHWKNRISAQAALDELMQQDEA